MSPVIFATIGHSEMASFVANFMVQPITKSHETSEVKYLNLYFLSYMCKGTIVPGTLVCNLLQKGISPMHYTLNNNRINLPKFDTGINGHIDSIRDLLFHDNFIKPYSSQHLLAYMLLKHFSRLIFYFAFIHHLDYTFYIILLCCCF